MASYAGIPLTHRDYAQACVFVTGHLKDGTMNLDWAALARPRQTIVIYMGLLGLPTLCAAADRARPPPDLPAAIVQQGTHARASASSPARWPRCRRSPPPRTCGRRR